MTQPHGLESRHDHARLARQRKAVFALMRDGEWRTLARISALTDFPEASVSARLRDFRKPKFGGYTVERRRVRAHSGQYEYRVIVQIGMDLEKATMTNESENGGGAL